MGQYQSLLIKDSEGGWEDTIKKMADYSLSSAVTEFNAFKGMFVTKGRDWIWPHQNDSPIGKILAVGPSHILENEETPKGWCVVKWGNHIANYRIGANGCYDLDYATNQKELELEFSNSIYSLKNKKNGIIKVQRFNSTIRKGIGRRSNPIQIRTGRAKCKRCNF